MILDIDLAEERRKTMATERYYACSQCAAENWVGNLFDALRAAANDTYPTCPLCGARQRLRLAFPFGLGAGTHKFEVVATYCPDSAASWRDEKGLKVEFFPFLVVMKKVEDPSKKTIWLPYWHLHYKRQSPHRKYGQWAPHMDTQLFAELVKKAQEDHHF